MQQIICKNVLTNKKLRFYQIKTLVLKWYQNERRCKMEKVPMQIRVPIKLKEKLEQISKQKGLTINAIIVQTLWNL